MTDLDLLSLSRRVDRLLAPWAVAGSPGCTIGVVRGAELLLHRSAGLASIELGVPIGPETRFRVASVTKQFTCAAVLMLVQEGRLELDDDVRRHLPELPEFDSRITVAQLMHNSSGIRDMLEIMRLGGADLPQPCGATALLAGI